LAWLVADEPVVDIGDRRELFLDDHIVGSLENTEFKLHSPQRLTRQPPRPFGHYATLLKLEDRYRLYYRGDLVPGFTWKQGWGIYHENEVTLVAESKNGYEWTEPDLGLYDFETFPKGNVVLAGEFLVTHNFTPFVDTRPGVPEDERFKATGGGRYPESNWGGWKQAGDRERLEAKHGPGGVYAYASPDGIHWRRLQEEPVIPADWGRFDSQNVAFWSEAEQCYVCYFRTKDGAYRAINRSTSPDFLHWSEPVLMQGRMEKEHLYTSGTQPYYRAPHIYLAPATRFMDQRSSLTDVVLMSSRAGSQSYDRKFAEAWIRPGLSASGWGNRQNYITWQIHPTSKTHLSLYMYGGAHYRLRIDGFVSVNAGFEQGEFRTKPLVFSGDQLEINYSTSAAGFIEVELQRPDGTPIPGFALEDSRRIYGDDITRFVRWEGGPDLSQLVGSPVVLRFVMAEADLYSLKFNESSAGEIGSDSSGSN